MTKINKLVMHGFKSFASKTEFTFGNSINCVLGPNGNGKCVTGDTQVHLGDGTVTAIKDLIESKEKTNKINKIDDGYIIEGDNEHILCLDIDTYQLDSKPIKAYVKRTTPEKLVKITTRSGRSVTSTPYHPLFIRKNDKLASVKAEELKTGTKIAVPEIIESINEGFIQIQLSTNLCWDEITNIEQIIPKEEWVYDLCVDKHHNFVANNIYVHNSNVLDAICFVLGRASSKSLRAENSAALIYNGGKSKKPSDKGEVQIFFDNSKKTFPLDTQEVKVSRIIKKNGQSKYKINDKTLTRNEVLELLSAARIDPDGYNIILQGDITRFVEMSPVERRLIAEEISGISVYEERKHKAVLELEKVQQKLNDIDIILNERKTHLKELKKDRDHALKFKELKDSVDSNKATFISIQLDKKNEIRQKYENELGALKEKLSESEADIEEKKKAIQQKKEEIAEINRDIEKKGEVEQVKLNKSIENMRVDIEKQKARVVMIKDTLIKIKQRKQALEKDIIEIGKSISALEKEKKELESHHASNEKELANFDNKMSQLKKKNNLDTLGDVEQEIEKADKEIEQKQEHIQKVRQEQQELLREKDRLEFQIQTLDERVKKVAEVEKSNQKQISELKSKKERFKQATNELNAFLDKDSKLSMQMGELRKQLSALQEEHAKLEARKVSAREHAGGDLAIRKVLAMKQSGIHGTIAELGTVSKSYSLALEIAAGPRLNSIVVDDDKIASYCIKHIRDNKLGVATFIPLNKIKAPSIRYEIQSLTKTKGVHDLCLNIIKYDKMFKKAFEYVFGDTIVIDNLDVARSIGIGKARMVTLQGDLAEQSGLMRGGYHHKKFASFKESEIDNEYSKIQGKIGELTADLGSYGRVKESNEEKINSLRREKLELEGTVAAMEKTLHLGSEDIDSTKQQKGELVSGLKKIENSLSEVQQKIGSINKELAQLKITKEQHKVKVSQLRSPQLLAEIAAFDEARQKLKDANVQLKSKISNITLQIQNMMLPESERIQQLIKGHGKEEFTFTTELDNLNQKIISGSEELKKQEKVQRDFFSAYKDLFHKRDKLSNENNALENAVENIRGKSRGVEIDYNNLSLKSASIKSEIAGIEAQLQPFKNAKLLKGKSEEELKSEISKFEKMLESMTAVNMKALEIYEAVEAEYNKLIENKDKLVVEKTDVLALMEEIEAKKKEQFMKTFEEINVKFQDRFSSLSSKGKAFLHLENAAKPFEGGMDIKIRLTGQRYMDIRSLSGGEKTLTALAFYFAVQEFQPHSFYVMDEVDAALDKHNSERLAHLLKQYSKGAQYIIISHNDNVISEADYLYGVSMDEGGVSKVVSLKI